MQINLHYLPSWMLTQYDTQASLQIAIFAVVFSDLLTRRGELLERYGFWLDRLEKKHPKLAKPLGYCAKCFGGQIALWAFPFIAGARGFHVCIRWVCFVSFTIFLCAAFSAALAKLSR